MTGRAPELIDTIGPIENVAARDVADVTCTGVCRPRAACTGPQPQAR